MRFHPSAYAAAILLSASSADAFGFAPSAVPRSTATLNNGLGGGARTAPLARPAFGLPVRPTAPTATALHLAGGGGPEALDEYLQSLSGSESKFGSRIIKNPKLIKLAGVAALPLTYLAGAAVTPSRRLAARAVGGVVAAATAGGIGKSAVEEDVRRACPAAVARRLRDLGVEDPNVADGVARLQEDYGLDDEDFAEVCTKVYAVYLAGMAKNPLAKTAELKELASLKAALGLDNQQAGQGHGDAASSFYRDVTRFTSAEELDDVDHPDRVSLDKLLFLTERALRQGGETEEAFVFEFSRVARALGRKRLGLVFPSIPGRLEPHPVPAPMPTSLSMISRRFKFSNRMAAFDAPPPQACCAMPKFDASKGSPSSSRS